MHPNQVTGWKRQAQEGLQEVFASGTNRREADHEAIVHDLHRTEPIALWGSKIGELTVERDFLSRGLGS